MTACRAIMLQKKGLKRVSWLALFGIGLLALVLRGGGLFRGLESGYTFHPDEAKQIMALTNFVEDRYVWYTGSLFYDGYPLGLNHLAEWILRPILAGHRKIVHYLVPECPTAARPDKVAFYYWARGLRVVYGLLGLWLAIVLFRRVLAGRAGVLAGALLLALAPLPIAVAHVATGDIGTDLFTLVALVSLCRYARCAHPKWMACAGLATGLAFSCKYNGALAGVAVALVILLGLGFTRPLRKPLAAAGAAALGFLAGVLLGTPALLIDRHRTWRDMRANFEFIQQYGTPSGLLALPAGERVLHSLTHNVRPVLGALGWGWSCWRSPAWSSRRSRFSGRCGGDG